MIDLLFSIRWAHPELISAAAMLLYFQLKELLCNACKDTTNGYVMRSLI